MTFVNFDNYCASFLSIYLGVLFIDTLNIVVACFNCDKTERTKNKFFVFDLFGLAAANETPIHCHRI